MLEEILKSINSNLERIAKSQEETLKYIREPIKFTDTELEGAIRCIENIENKIKIRNEANTDASIQQNRAIDVAPIQQTPTDINMTNPYVQQANTPQTVVAQPAMPQAIPTSQVQESFTQEQLAVAMSNAVSAGKMNIIQGILQQLGVQALTQVNPSDYNKVATMLKEAGVEV